MTFSSFFLSFLFFFLLGGAATGYLAPPIRATIVTHTKRIIGEGGGRGKSRHALLQGILFFRTISQKALMHCFVFFLNRGPPFVRPPIIKLPSFFFLSLFCFLSTEQFPFIYSFFSFLFFFFFPSASFCGPMSQTNLCCLLLLLCFFGRRVAPSLSQGKERKKKKTCLLVIILLTETPHWQTQKIE